MSSPSNSHPTASDSGPVEAAPRERRKPRKGHGERARAAHQHRVLYDPALIQTRWGRAVVCLQTQVSEGGMIRLETLLELKLFTSSFSSFILLLKLDKQFPIEQFEATVSQSTVPSPPLKVTIVDMNEARIAAWNTDSQPGRILAQMNVDRTRKGGGLVNLPFRFPRNVPQCS